MILQALSDYYGKLSEKGEISPEGWAPAKISYALVIDEEGGLVDVMPTVKEERRGKKTVLSPSSFELPQAVTRSSGIKANFLWDSSTYLLGIDTKGNSLRTRDCFEDCKKLHLSLLRHTDSGAAKAVCNFFLDWLPEKAGNHPALQGYLEGILKGANLIFRFAGGFVHEDDAVAQAWNNYRKKQAEDGASGRCLVTGNRGPIAQLHPPIKNVRGAQPSGAMLVSFNSDSAESYGKEQGYNSPVGQSAVLAYTAALNRLLSDKEHVQHAGNTTVVYWAETAQAECQDIFGCLMDNHFERLSEQEISRCVSELLKGVPYNLNGVEISPDTRFYVLGLTPNAARLSVRFFYRNTFGKLLENIEKHYERLKLVKPAYEPFERLSIGNLLYAAVNPNARGKSASPLLSGALYRAILNNSDYPQAFLNAVLLRIRSERKITWGRASAIKACLLKKLEKTPNQDVKEALTVQLNEFCTYQPYILGRLFSVYEALQDAANPEIKTTIKDKYFNSAAAAPASIFAVLTRMSGYYLRKLEGSQKAYYNQSIAELTGLITESLPARHSLSEQEVFYIGYYHQTQMRYQKKRQEEIDKEKADNE